ncbi:MAG: PP2C family protein-serine/threonine phosphatase [Flavobacteriales bacterium]|nr:PP2C family protein-serine/threonine phosphatase [Flavobacteriales bacterium]MCB9363328.1 PP2C family protein-serine/threonine phosphatase [Flavobacteriales bacterium]
MSRLLELTKAINNNLPQADLFKIYKEVLIDDLTIGKILLYSYDGEKWNQELCYGTECSIINVEKDLLSINEIVSSQSLDNPNLQDFDVIIPVFHKSHPLAYVLIGDLIGEKIEVSPIIKHLTFIQTFTNLIVVAIENKRLYKKNLNQIAIEKEMELASEMQTMLFPDKLPNNTEIEIAAKYLPHHMVGGDYYDFVQLNRDEIAFCIADVSGKGVSAALIMSNFQASLRSLIKRTSSLTELVTELNSTIIGSAKREKFITAFIGKYNCTTRNLQFINAGHNPPLLLIGHQFKELHDGCTILGMFEQIPSITEKNIKIPKNTVLMCFTDGVTEQTDINNVEFSTEALERIILNNKNKSITTLIENIISELSEFKAGNEFSDDVALLGLRFK